MLQLFGRDHAEHIRLILILVQGPAHIAVLIEGGVVPRRNRIEAKRHALCSSARNLIFSLQRRQGFGVSPRA